VILKCTNIVESVIFKMLSRCKNRSWSCCSF